MGNNEEGKGRSGNRVLRVLDGVVFSALMIFLAFTVVSSSMANIQTDSIDYYAIVQRLTGRAGRPIVRNLPFVEQRSPGYPILTLAPYALVSTLVEPFVPTERIELPSARPGPPRQAPTERMLLPAQPILFRDIFYKDFYIATEDSWFEWPIIASMLFTSFGFLFVGLAATAAALGLGKKAGTVLGLSLAPLVALSSSVFMHNVVDTPAYATLTAFGVSSLFGYCFVKGSLHKALLWRFMAGLCLGFLALTRLEIIVFAGGLAIGLLVVREFRFVRDLVAGGLAAAIILLAYNAAQFGNPFHIGILKGDINLLMLDWGYIYASVFDPQSGILFWSPLVTLGIVGLFVGRQRHLKLLGVASLALIALVLVRVPVMYTCIGEGPKLIDGLPITCPRNMAEMTNLIRSDTNRYVTVLIPFSVLGLQSIIASLTALWRGRQARAADARHNVGNA